MSQFFWSDLHVSHVNLATKWRPWAGGTVESHNEMLKERWNKTIKPNDDVLIAGDMCMGILTDSLEFCKGLRGNITLLGGNHDRFHPSYSHTKPERRAEFLAKYQEVFNIDERNVVPGDEFGLDSGTIIGHFPWLGVSDHAESDREYLEKYYPKREDYPIGTVLVHGHTHSSRYYDVPMGVSVGVDSNPEGPLPIDLVQHLIDGARLNEFPPDNQGEDNE